MNKKVNEHRLKALQMIESHDFIMAGWELTKAIGQGDIDSYAELGELIYDGRWTADLNPDVNEALVFWEAGAKLGSRRCMELYQMHKHEKIIAPKTIHFTNGDVYTGDVNSEGLPHGRGHMEYKINGYIASYDGMWADGKRSGKGRYHKFSSGGGARHSYDYDGEWLNDLQHGEGKETQSDERGVHLSTVTEVYTGSFKEGKRHGHGVILEDNFDGSFTDGKNRFEGEFSEGRTIGKGVCKYANGDTFEGEFADYGNKHGHGVYTYKSGLRLEGEWKLDSLILESVKADPSLRTPLLIVSEHHSGFDYSHSGRFIFAPRKGFMPYSEAASLGNSLGPDCGLEIMEVSDDSVTFKVNPSFTKDSKAVEATILRGQTLRFEDTREGSARIYDEEYDYTIEDALEVICR